MLTCSVANCGERAREKGMCRPHYARWKRNGDPLGGRIKPGTGEAWLRAHKDHADPATCLLWPFGRGGNGYAAIYVNGERVYAHRFMCELVNGPPPAGAMARHSCNAGNKGCMNPQHLSWGTAVDNAADRTTHGTHGRGERANGVKLTQAQVDLIRANPENKTNKDLAKDFGVADTTISKIRRHLRWKEKAIIT